MIRYRTLFDTLTTPGCSRYGKGSSSRRIRWWADLRESGFPKQGVSCLHVTDKVQKKKVRGQSTDRSVETGCRYQSLHCGLPTVGTSLVKESIYRDWSPVVRPSKGKDGCDSPLSRWRLLHQSLLFCCSCIRHTLCKFFFLTSAATLV